jgi:hypothetical protein
LVQKGRNVCPRRLAVVVRAVAVRSDRRAALGHVWSDQCDRTTSTILI